MKIKSNYVLKTIGDNIVVVPIKSEALRFNGIITLNKTGKYLFETLQNEDLSKEELLKRVLEKYEVDSKRANTDIDDFIKECLRNDILDEKSL